MEANCRENELADILNTNEWTFVNHTTTEWEKPGEYSKSSLSPRLGENM